MTVQDIETKEYQTHLDIPRFDGMSTHNEHGDNSVTELRDTKNLIILSDGGMIGRNGSQYLKATSSPAKRGSTSVINAISWDIGDDEYLITQEGDSFYYQKLTATVGNPTLIAHVVSGTFTVSNTDPADMFLSGDRIYVFHTGGNKIIEYDKDGGFTGRPMGITKPVISTIAVIGGGGVFGKYTWGVEKVYQVSGVDKVGSTPNRKYTTRKVNVFSATSNNSQIKLEIRADELDDDNLWTHIRLWRSKNQNTNYDDNENPIDATGLPEELYEVALITKAEMQAGSLTAVATGKTSEITHVSAGYTNCVAGDIGKAVVGGTSSTSGTLLAYNNSTRKWLVNLAETDDYTASEAITITTGTGAGTLDATDFQIDHLLPVGNSNVTAGSPSSVYSITDSCNDDELGELVDLDRIELSPMPSATVGAYHDDKIFVADVTDKSYDDDSGDNIYYSLWGGTKYSELHDPQNFIKTGRHGQKITRLLSFENDLIVFKEGKTGRVQDGDVTNGFDIIDPLIGVEHRNFAENIPSIGICAITNDNGDFKIFGYDYIWSSYLNGLELSRPLREETSAMTGANVSIRYLNGNLLISDGAANIYCLNAEQKKGWTKHVYTMNGVSERLFTFANGSRGGVVSKSTHLVEIDVDGVEDDIDTSDDLSKIIPVDYTTYKFRSNDGFHLMEFDSYSVMGKFKYNVTLIPFVNGVTWPLKTTDTETRFLTQPNLYTTYPNLRDKEHRCYVEPATIGDYSWQVPVGNFMHFKIKTYAPCTIRQNKLWCVIDEEPGYEEFDPFQMQGSYRVGPDWARRTIQETGSAANTIQESGSQSDTIQEGVA